MWPMALNFHSACCQRPMSAASAAASTDLAARDCVRKWSSNKEGGWPGPADNSCQSVVRYFKFKPCSRATASSEVCPAVKASRFSSVAAKYSWTGSRPPPFVSN